MLMELKVSNFAIIEHLHLNFKPGLNIISGETGAGKSILLKSLALLMGNKAAADTIRVGFDCAIIEGCFDLEFRKDIVKSLTEMGISVEENVLVVRRIVHASDKSKVYLNGCLSSVGQLRDIIAPLIEVAGPQAPLIEMTGQHDSRHLLSKSFHLEILDQYAGLWDERQKIQQLFDAFKNSLKKLADLRQDGHLKEQRLDFLKFQQEEIENFNLQPDIDINLESELQKIKNAQKIENFISMCENLLNGEENSACNQLQIVLKKSLDLKGIDTDLIKLVEPLAQAQSCIEEVAYNLRHYFESLDFDPSSLEELSARVSDLKRLQKKYGPSIPDILVFLGKIQQEILDLETNDLQIHQLEKEVEELSSKLEKLANNLHQKRSNASRLLADSVNKELLDLNMKGVSFHVQVKPLLDMTSTGKSDVEFLSQNSSKDILRPLAKVASGGELSRILLSLKRVIGTSQWPRTYLFDEVDTGVSGETAEKVGKKLKSIAQGQQVICVTHLPQVAAYADNHFLIYKLDGPDTATMNLLELTKQDRVKEIARLISGEKISKTSLAHAEQLLKSVSK